jgi:hypothetical protein
MRGSEKRNHCVPGLTRVAAKSCRLFCIFIENGRVRYCWPIPEWRGEVPEAAAGGPATKEILKEK